MGIISFSRAEQLNHHRGQVAFPGGRVDPDDRGELAAALRESHEEIGIAPSDVRVLGRLDQVTAASDFVVTPFIGVIPPFYEFRLNPAETDAVFLFPSLSARSECVVIADHLSSTANRFITSTATAGTSGVRRQESSCNF